MRIGRTLPPAAAPIRIGNIAAGFRGIIRGSKELSNFETQIKLYFDVNCCSLFSSGKAALTIILKALHKLSPHKNEVLIPAFTCYSVPSAIIRAGLKIRLCDLDSDTLDFDFGKIDKIFQEKQTSSKILAVIPIHLFGFHADIPKLRACLYKTDTFIIEDAAQAMGSRYHGQKAGTIGDVGFFSLGRGKSLSTVEGGIAITNKNDIAKALREQMNQAGEYSTINFVKLVIYSFILVLFTKPYLFWLPKSLTFLGLGKTIFDPEFKIKRMTAYQAGLASGWEKRVKMLNIKRSEIFKRYLDKIKTNSVYKVPMKESDTDYEISPIRFPVVFKNSQKRETVLSKSEKKGFGIMPSYPDSIDHLGILESGSQQSFTVAKNNADFLITLPIHEYVTQKDIKNITSLVSN